MREMKPGSIERRRARRASIQALCVIRRIGAGEPERFKEQVTADIGLAGIYFETEDQQPYVVNEVVVTSVSIPESSRREFPFIRLAGRGRVVRVRELGQPQAGDDRKRWGVALEFYEDLTALTASPTRS